MRVVQQHLTTADQGKVDAEHLGSQVPLYLEFEPPHAVGLRLLRRARAEELARALGLVGLGIWRQEAAEVGLHAGPPRLGRQADVARQVWSRLATYSTSAPSRRPPGRGWSRTRVWQRAPPLRPPPPRHHFARREDLKTVAEWADARYIFF